MAKPNLLYNPEIRVSFDVDETLVRFENDEIVVHKGHVEALKQHWVRGHHVRVHSAGGGNWAKYIVEELGLTDYVHEAVAKDSWYIDDKPADLWMDRYFVKEEGFNNGRSIGTNQEAIGSDQAGTSLPSVTYRGSSVVYPLPEIQGFGCTITSQASQSGNGVS